MERPLFFLAVHSRQLCLSPRLLGARLARRSDQWHRSAVGDHEGRVLVVSIIEWWEASSAMAERIARADQTSVGLSCKPQPSCPSDTHEHRRFQRIDHWRCKCIHPVQTSLQQPSSCLIKCQFVTLKRDFGTSSLSTAKPGAHNLQISQKAWMCPLWNVSS